MVARRGIAPLLILLSGCVTEEWSRADLQLDITGAHWESEARARLCVDGVGNYEEAMAAGLIGYTGVPEDIEVVLTGDILDDSETSGAGIRLGRAGPISFADGDWQAVAWEECDGDCPACTTSGERVDSGGLLLAVRFQ